VAIFESIPPLIVALPPTTLAWLVWTPRLRRHRRLPYEGRKYRDIIAPASLGNSTRAWGVDGVTVVGSYLNSRGFARGFITVIPEPIARTLATMLGAIGMMGRHRGC
jgi:hypothetical protein